MLPSWSVMDLRQLAALTAVADHHSFSAAARALHTVQSNVSTHVARLERELRVPLVERATGNLTEAGALVVARARRIQGELESLVSDVASSVDHISGTVRLGMIGTTGRWLVPVLLGAVAETYPRIQLIVVDATTTSLLPQLVSGQLDLSVVNLPVDDPDVEAERLFDEDRVLVAPEGHPLAAKDRITLTELAEHRLILEPKGTAFRDLLDQEIARAGATLVPLAEVDGLRLVATLAFEGFGPAILPATAAPSWLEGRWRRVEVEGITPRSVGLATRRRALLSAPGRAVHAVVLEVVASEAPNHRGLQVCTP
jgi:LysR family hydrogen peroxide-inducible transcriptional activator